jgi:hypothetical protein
VLYCVSRSATICDDFHILWTHRISLFGRRWFGLPPDCLVALVLELFVPRLVVVGFLLDSLFDGVPI